MKVNRLVMAMNAIMPNRKHINTIIKNGLS